MNVPLAVALLALGVALAGSAIAGQQRPPRRPRLPAVVITSIVPAVVFVIVPTLGVLLLPTAVAVVAFTPRRHHR